MLVSVVFTVAATLSAAQAAAILSRQDAEPQCVTECRQQIRAGFLDVIQQCGSEPTAFDEETCLCSSQDMMAFALSCLQAQCPDLAEALYQDCQEVLVDGVDPNTGIDGGTGIDDATGIDDGSDDSGSDDPCTSTCAAQALSANPDLAQQCSDVGGVACFCSSSVLTSELEACFQASCPDRVQVFEDICAQENPVSNPGNPTLTTVHVTDSQPTQTSSTASTETSPSSTPPPNSAQHMIASALAMSWVSLLWMFFL